MAIPSDDSSNIHDYLLGIDDLNRPKVIDMSIIKPGVMNSAILMIIRMILMRKGTIPDIPDLGIDIRGRYRFAFESELSILQNEITNQIQTYLPEFLASEVTVAMQKGEPDGPKVVIQITIDETTYELVYNISTNTLDGLDR